MTVTKTSAEEPLLLIDASGYLFRAYHALPSLSNDDGEPTGALYGVINMTRKLLAEQNTRSVAVVFDASGETFRNELYADYKANRPPMPDDLRRQIQPLHDWVTAMGLPLLCEPGVEADDVIGTLALRAAAAGREVVIVTGDKDMAQLVGDRVSLLDTMKNKRFDAAAVEEKYGVRPEQMIDYLALTGDSVDNIPGVPGVGPKTAAKWLAQHGTLERLVADAAAVKGKIGERLREHAATLPLSRELATIKLDVALPLEPSQLRWGEADGVRLAELYRRYGFKTWLAEVGAAAAASANASAAERPQHIDYRLITEQADFDVWLRRLQDAELFAFDTETDSLNYMRAEIVGVSFAVEPGEAAYLPLAHDYPGAPDQLDRDAVLGRLKPLLEDPDRAKVGQHLKYDAHVLRNHGIELRGVAHDTMLESYVLNSTSGRHDMDSLALHYLGVQTTKFEDVAGKGVKQLTFNQVPLEQAGPYAAEDADVTLRLHRALWPRLQAEPSLAALYGDLEIPLIGVLGAMEQRGVLIDAERLREQSGEIAKRLLQLEKEAHELAGQPFNLGSPKQLREILFERQGLPVQRKTPTGQPSTDESVLAELAHDFPLPRLILEHRGLAKLKSTYADKLPQLIEPRSGRVHTSYHQAVTSTGRLSSSDPNLQNIPIRTPEGRRIRQAFVAPEGWRIVASDYSQIELRIMAHLSADAGLVGAFADNADVHQATAAELFSVAPDQVDGDQRRLAKTINFALMYGMSAFGLGRSLGISRGAAQDYMDRYFERYPGVRGYLDGVREQAAERGYVETVFGRRLYLPDIHHRSQQRRQGAERAAINAPMQGTAADIIKRAMLLVDNWLARENLQARMIMQVHDELVFEVAEDDVDALSRGVRERMIAAAQLSVPLDVGIGSGLNWDQAH